MNYIPKVIDAVVKNDLCIGCGMCVYKCPSKALEMNWDEYGFLIPKLSGNCDGEGACLTVCPFNPFPEQEVKTENELGNLFLKNTNQYHPKVGRYNGIYAGYSNEFRLTSSSGGIATYIFTELLEKGIVDHIFSVKESNQDGFHYEYGICSSKEEILAGSKTKYYPVTLATVMSKIHVLEGKVATVGVACFIKAIRLAQHKEPALREKIPFLIGIICGGVKSRFFTEYLAGKSSVIVENIKNPEFRIKDYNSTAGDYAFGCFDKNANQQKTIKMRTVGDMWGTGLFKANACDFCDDVTTELADVSLGDAWLQPYNVDGRGTNVVVTRSTFADTLIQDGVEEDKLTIEKLPLDRFLASQQGSFNHRHTGLSVRIKEAKKKNHPIPPKRFGNEKITLNFKIVQSLRMIIRQKSLDIWKMTADSVSFDKSMKNPLKQLKFVTQIYHYRREIEKRIQKLIK
ncbi:MAG: Coenzyme F420 hydrogenase/dehydrogenase, beta subunit C-terminal domain [Bacteroidales bacterium]|nr:Coenzyme F420 hydrogenase/dehydrogenase, beta subunit C-terminal domain [Bacteroidales bacterium]